ncbi:MAG: hypothetical protein KC425_14225, partial [Anaerolineales bacterium]|nr:hypothetical protein [Anaerolineales bacterium]
MKIAMIGLGKMGGNMTRRLLAGGHRVVVSDLDVVLMTRRPPKATLCPDAMLFRSSWRRPRRVVWV